MAIDVILGLQWGDEGKGKIVDYLADQYACVCRFQGGPNAGHTLIIDGVKYVLHTIPSGIFRKNTMNVIGNGVVVDPVTLLAEIKTIDHIVTDLRKRLLIAKKAHLILPTHRWIDLASEHAKGKMKIGSTLRGIGPCYMDKTGRNGLRIGDLLQAGFDKKYQALREKHLSLIHSIGEVDFFIEQEETAWLEAIEGVRKLKTINAEYFVNDLIRKDVNILAEGAQGSMLDVDFGTYPYVTSSNTITAGVCTGLGVAPSQIRKVIGITKAYCTRVGSGPFPTELHDAVGEKLRKAGNEFGSTTGRPRRCGWLDLVQLNYSIMINGVTDLVITKVDVLNEFDEIQLCSEYTLDGNSTKEIPYDLAVEGLVPQYETIKGWKQDVSNMSSRQALPPALQSYFDKIEEECSTQISYISTGPQREALIINS